MSPAVLAALAAALVLSGILVAILGFRRVPVDETSPRNRPARQRTAAQNRRLVTLAVGAGVGVLLAILTGWIVSIIIVPIAAVGIPYLLGSGDAEQSIDRLEAMEEWTRSLAGVLVAGVSLEQAMISTLKSTKAPIRPEVQKLVARLNSRMPTEQALLLFADELNDVTGDKICAALILGAQRRTGIATLLEDLAKSVAEEVRGRRVIEADRAKPRTTARWVTIVTLVMLTALFFSGSYVAPYGTPLGQAVLVSLLAAFAGVLLWMKRMTVAKPMPRFLGATARSR